MSSIENQDSNNFTTGSAHPHYRNIPLDLTTSPLEKYFQDMYLSEINGQKILTDTTTAALSDESLRHYSRAEPIWIPGALDANRLRHSERQRRADHVSTTFPSAMNSFATAFDNNYTTGYPIFSAVEGTQNHNQFAQSREPVFTVGSLVDRPPAPWPASFTLPHDDSRYKTRASHQQDDDSANDSIESGDILFDCENDTENII